VCFIATTANVTALDVPGIILALVSIAGTLNSRNPGRTYFLIFLSPKSIRINNVRPMNLVMYHATGVICVLVSFAENAWVLVKLNPTV
jgi:hypothetical protein